MRAFRSLLVFTLLAPFPAASVAADRRPAPCAGTVADVLGPTPAMDRLNRTGATVLETPRLRLRTPRRDDMAELLPIFQDAPTVRFTWFNLGEGYWTLARVGERYEAFVTDQEKGVRRDFMVRLREAPESLVGRCALYPGQGEGSWEFGITLYRPYWGRRYAAEVIEAILRYVFEDLGGREVRFRTEPENEPMLKQYPRLGIPKVIDVADDVPEPPLYHRYHHFAITRDAWRAKR